MTIATAALVPRAAPQGGVAPRSPGFGRAFGRMTVAGFVGQGYQGGRTVPLVAAAVRAYVPGTSTPWPDPLYLDEAGTTPVVFPVATDETGAVAFWADAAGRLELDVDAAGYAPQRVVLDLEPPPDAAPTPVDAYTKAESDLRYEPLDSAYTKPESDARYLAIDYVPPATDLTNYYTKPESDARYLAIDYVPPPPVIPPEYLTEAEGDLRYAPFGAGADGITQADADVRYVNTAGDAMSGDLAISKSDPALVLSGPAGTERLLRFSTGTSDRWALMASSGAESGSDAGSDLDFDAYGDAGNYLRTPLTLRRATGNAVFRADVLPGSDDTRSLGGAGARWRGHFTDLQVDSALTGWTVNLSGGLNAAGASITGLLEVKGSSGALYVQPRTGTHPWLLYNDADTLRFFYAAVGDLATLSPAGLLTLAGKPVAVSPDASNTLEWRANGFYTAGGGGGSGLPTTGGTMTGTIASRGAAVDAGGALAVTSPDVTVTDARVFGAGSPAASWITAAIADDERGLRFTPTTPLYLMAVRWYRIATGTTVPQAVSLWDTTSPGAPVWTRSAPPEWADTAPGWKEHRLAPGTQPALVAGRSYQLQFRSPATTSSQPRVTSDTPVPDAGLTVGGHYQSATGGAYATSATADGLGIDGAFRSTTVVPDPAASGAVRLPNGAGGALAWRNAGNTADLSLTMDASDRPALTVGAGALTTSATTGAAGAPPAQVAGYLTAVLNGTPVKLPYYLP